MYPYVYEVSYMNFLNHEPISECGAGFAENFTDAVRCIEEYYEEDLLAIKYLTLGEENDIIFISKEMMKEIEKNF